MKFKKNEKWNKIILLVLCGVLLLVIAMPQKTETSDTTKQISVDACVTYETRLKELLEDTYGKGMIDVLIYAGTSTADYYAGSKKEEITGVLITVKQEVVSGTTISDITLAVCALFDLPAHKVAVLVKK